MCIYETYVDNTYRELKNYSFITEDELLYLLGSKCFFGRKFNQECIIHNKYIDFITSK